MSTKENTEKKVTITLPRKSEYNMAYIAGQDYDIGQKIKVPVIDAHMHIQSNNIAPCTLQWGMMRSLLASALANNQDLLKEAFEKTELYSGIAKWGAIPLWIFGNFLVPVPLPVIRSASLGAAVIITILADAVNNLVKYLEKKDIDDIGNLLLRKADKELLNTIQACASPLLMGDFGKLGVLDTDVVGKVFMGYDGELDVQDYAVTYQTYEHIKELYNLDADKFPFENSLINTASDKFLEKMSEEKARNLMKAREKMMQNFSHFTKYYFENRAKTHLYYTLPMDLEYAHYWGYYSLPIYLPKSSEDLYFISEVPYYLGFMDNLRYFVSYIEKEKNSQDKILPLKVKELVSDRVQNKIINPSKKNIDSKILRKLENHYENLTKLETAFVNDSTLKGKIDELETIIDEVKQTINKLVSGRTETKERGIIERLTVDVIYYICGIIDEYMKQADRKNRETGVYSSVPADYQDSVKQKIEEIARDAEELYKAYHTLSCYAGKRIEDLEEFFKENLDTLIIRLEKKLFFYMDDCIYYLLFIRSEEQSGNTLAEGHFYKQSFNNSYNTIIKNKEDVINDIQEIEKVLKKEIDTVNEQIDVYNAGYNKILWHGIKPGNYRNYFRFGYVQCKDIENVENEEKTQIVDKQLNDLFLTVHFADWSFELSTEEKNKINEAADTLIQKCISLYLRYLCKVHIKILGHTGFSEESKNDRGYLAKLQTLSENRAEAAKTALLEVLGNYESLVTITTEGCSYNYPVVSFSDKSVSIQNLRSEIYIMKGGISHDDDEYEKYLDKPVNHYLEIAPGNEKKYFEPYSVELARTIATGLRYPLKILPFYKYDPRRHYEGGEGFLKKLVKDIKENHGFFELEHGEDMKKPMLLPVDFTDAYLLNLLKKNKEENQFAFDNLDTLKIGICWGYKMYTMLGYPPKLFDTSTYPVKNDAFKGRFDHYESFFRHCVSAKIPITCHGSPAAMTIADSILYLKEHNNESPESDKFKDRMYYHIPEEIKESLQFIDDSFVRPDSWRKVLETQGLETLILNLAHFCGYDSWFDHEGKNAKYAEPDWRDELIGLVRDFENVYTDISCYNNVEENLKNKVSIAEYNGIIDKLDNDDKRLFEKAYEPYYIYFQFGRILSHYRLAANEEEQRVVRRILRRKGLIKDNLEEVADNLAKKINEEPKLKDRILMGSDWPMFERTFTGAGEYYSRMFELLTRVTKHLKEDHNQDWDAWHQFSVINPLRFLGILKDEDREQMTLDMEKIEKHKLAIENFLDYEGDDEKEEILIKDYRIYDDISKILKSDSGIHSLAGNFKKLKEINEFKIDQSDKILDPADNENLLILKE